MTKNPTPIRHLSEDFAVASQLDAMDFAFLKARGFRTVINNRPDEEADGQHMQSSYAAELAEAHGLNYVYLPVTGLDVTEDEAVNAFAAAVAENEGPILAHCASGMRAAILWALAQGRDRSADDIVTRAADAGIDLDIIRPELDALAA